MLRWFIDKKGERLEVDRVLKEGLMADEYPAAYLAMCAQQRKWTGVPSVTQLINGIRESFLRIVTDWAMDPDDSAFMVLGSKGHARLERAAELTEFAQHAELVLSEADITGIADSLEETPDSRLGMTDYKTWGSYRVAKALGYVEEWVPMVDQNGAPVLLQSGKNRGQQRTTVQHRVDKDAADLFDVTWQLNAYRKMAEKLLQRPIEWLRVFAIVRDGGTYLAKQRGIDRKTYYIDVPFKTDEEVDAFFKPRGEQLVQAVNTYHDLVAGGMSPEKALIHTMPERCSARENWDGRKCDGYCPVADVCRKYNTAYDVEPTGPLFEKDGEAQGGQV